VAVEYPDYAIHQRDNLVGGQEGIKFIGMPWLGTEATAYHHFKTPNAVLDFGNKAEVVHIGQA